ncbi:MFS general substrate transporter [Saccharata proteae CBS 121410]|uniref:MFS general substrate transporter n=1 Tax=Saccharata proteae CBS 121410 TaxID=1314787 RepID=A0A9P4I0M6_9PEZI|nr:MFS general substrate transporter [Saccharata proteae CBS 121410]
MKDHVFDISLPEQSEVLELAAEEGHDADIPSNLGVYHPNTDGSTENINAKTKADTQVDIEKSAVSSQISISQSEDHSHVVQPEATNPNIVDFDGPNDPTNPMNWTSSRKWGMIMVVSVVTLLTPLGSSMFAPGVPQLMEEFGSTSDVLAGLVVSVYVLGFAFGPLLIAPLSELYGRVPLYHACNLLFVIFNIACSLSTNLNMLIGFRFLAGSVGSCPLALGGGTIADLIPREQRGTAMALWVAGPTIGPLAGGFLSQAENWRWVFRVISITAAIITFAGFFLLKETYGPAILSAKTKRLQTQTGNTALRSKLDAGLSPKDLFLFSIVRPTKLLIKSPIVLLLSLYVAVAYSYLYILFTTFTTVYEQQYGFNTGTAGLTYLGVGIGCALGQFIYTIWGNRSVRKHLAAGDFKPEHRLPMMYPGAIAMPIGLFWYGWSAQAHTHWIVPILGTGLVGFALILIFMAPNTYLVDVYTRHAASAMAANTVLRSVFAAFVPLGGQEMYAKLGLGWGNSLLAFVSIVLIPIPVLFVRYGERLRTKFQVKL